MMVILVFIVLWIILQLLGAAGVHVGGPFRLGELGGSVAATTAWSAVDLSRLLKE
jgi:hypothetical protein